MLYEITDDKDSKIFTHDVDVAILFAEFISTYIPNIVLLEYEDLPTSIPKMGWLYNNGKTQTVGKATNVEIIPDTNI